MGDDAAVGVGVGGLGRAGDVGFEVDLRRGAVGECEAGLEEEGGGY